ncbi:MAG: hypothetical protein QXT19_03655 [Candidatus Woesearchaeota archaeon]
MKKRIFAVLCIAIFILQSMIVFAGVSPYTDYKSMTTSSSVIRKIGMPTRTQTCNLQITADPTSIYFLGEARRECIQNNKGNLFCQQECLDKMKLYIYTGKYDRQLGLLGAYNCKGVSAEEMTSAKSASQCYYVAKNTCTLANPNQDYCRRKCTENAYAHCRQAIAQLRFTK